METLTWGMKVKEDEGEDRSSKRSNKLCCAHKLQTGGAFLSILL